MLTVSASPATWRPRIVFMIAASAAGYGWRVPAARADDAAVAEQLFRDGKRLMGEGRTAEACLAFAGSYRKQAATSTLVNLADCEEKNGQYASAWSNFVEAARMLRDDPAKAALRDVATTRATHLESRLSYLQIDVPAPAIIEGLEVLRNDVVLDHAEWGARIAVDGGEYTVVARAPGREAWSTTVGVGAEHDWRTISVPALTGVTAQVSSPVPRPAPSRLYTVGKWTVVGGATLVASSLVTGYLAKTKFDDAKGLCGADLHCETVDDRNAAQDLVDSARLRGNVSTLLASAGFVAVGAGVGMWLSGRPRTTDLGRSGERRSALQVVPRVTPTTVGVVVGGGW